MSDDESVNSEQPAYTPTDFCLVEQSEYTPNTAGRIAPLLVSLFLFLLTFFILLNSIATQESKKMETAVISLQKSFPKGEREPSPLLRFVERKNESDEPLEGSIFSIARKTAESSLALVSATENSAGNRLELTFITEAFFGEKNAKLRDTIHDFLVRLVDAVSLQHVGTKVHTELLFGQKLPPKDMLAEETGDYNARNTISIARAGVLSNALENLGLERGSLLAGVKPDAPLDRFTIVFHIRDDAPARPNAVILYGYPLFLKACDTAVARPNASSQSDGY